MRPSEVNSLIGNNAKAKKHLKWDMHYDFRSLVKEMVFSDLDLIKNKKFL